MSAWAPRSQATFFSDLKFWPLAVLKPLELWYYIPYSVSIVSPNHGTIAACLVKDMAALWENFIFAQNVKTDGISRMFFKIEWNAYCISFNFEKPQQQQQQLFCEKIKMDYQR